MTLIGLDDDEREVLNAAIETVNSALIALAAVIDEPGDARDMILRSALTARNAALVLTEKWLTLPLSPVEDVDAPKGATDDPETCGHPLLFPDLIPLGQKMCESCGASECPDGTWRVL